MRIILILAFVALVAFVVWDTTWNNGVMTHAFFEKLKEFVRSLGVLKDIRHTPFMPV